MNRLLKVKLPAFLLAMVMVISMVPVSFAASADKTYDVEEDDYVWLDAEDFWNLYDDLYDGDDFEYITFTNYDEFDDYGYFYADGYDSDEDYVEEYELNESDLEDAYFYYDEDDVEDAYEFELDTLKFVTYDDIDSDTLDFDVKLHGKKSFSATISIDIEGSGSSDAELSFEVDPDDDVLLDGDDFSDLFDEETRYNEDLAYLEFSSYDNFDSYGHFTVEDFDGEEYKLKNSSLDDHYFYYDDYYADGDDFDLNTLTFVADEDADEDTLEFSFTMTGDDDEDIDGTLYISVGKGSGSSSKKGDITIEMDANDEVTLDADDFWDFFDDETRYDEELVYLEFTDYDDFDDYGHFYAAGYDDDEDWDDEYELNYSDLEDARFYYDEDDAEDSYEFELDSLTFVTDRNIDEDTLEFEFTMTGDDDETIDGTLTITIGDGKGSSGKGDITIDLKPGAQAEMDPEDFNDVFQEEYRNYDFEYLVFTDSKNLNSYNGTLYVNYGRSSSESFTAGSLDGCKFYYDEDDIGSKEKYAYALEDLSFVAASTFLTSVTLEFRAYYSSSKYVDGTVVIKPKDGAVAPQVSGTTSILYQTTGANKVQIKANDFSNFLQSKYPSSTLQYVKLIGVPVTGGLYYNYYGASKYGSATRKQLTASTCGQYSFYLSPSALTQYALSELTYVPSGSNYAVSIPFTAYGTGSAVVSGTVTISVTSKAVPEVYGVSTKGSSTTFPAPQILQAVSSSIGSSRFYGIRLLSLPSSAQGAVYVGTGTSRKADTSTVYSYAGSGWTISQLRFVPTASFTGNVEIPYAVCDSSGNSLGVGKFSLGVVSSQKKFKDVSASTWCYKYVSELSSAGVIDGYSNGSFKPDSKISYGAALKLIMLAAGYPEQAPTVKNSPFSGYLAKARADGIITSSNVNLGKPITRLQVSQLAAGALKLNTSKVSSLKPFTDTSDRSVQALYEAGIVEGYFNNGTSTFKPNNTLTRGQVSAIVWRMEQYRK